MKDFKKMTEEEQNEVKNMINAAIEAAGGKNFIGTDKGADPTRDQTNSRGFEIDKVYTVEGVVVTKVDGSTTAYPALKFTNGQTASLRNFIRYSISGYVKEGTLVSEGMDKKKVVKNDITIEVSNDVKSEDFDKDTLYMTEYTNAWMLYYALSKNEVELPKELKYLGKVGRQWEAKKDSPSGSFDTYKAGQKRVSTLNLWTKA